MARRSYKGKFKPKNPKKYKGDPTSITYRSLLERTFFVYLDTNSNVLEWQSEEVIIPYISPIDNKVHRYFTDVWMMHRTPKGDIAQALIEIKPKSQTAPPKPLTGARTQKKKMRYLREVQTWGVNDAKWKAAQEWCKKNNCKWVILTEEDIRRITGVDLYNTKKRAKAPVKRRRAKSNK